MTPNEQPPAELLQSYSLLLTSHVLSGLMGTPAPPGTPKRLDALRAEILRRMEGKP